jgi:AcrR family transcriptional regulator
VSPRFSPEERARIAEQLLAAGRELFATQGLAKTSLDELVRPAGIARSSFYAFFDSKEALYLELMLRQAPDVRGRVMGSLEQAGGDVRSAMAGFLRSIVAVLDGDPLYRRLITHPDELRAVARKLDPRQVAGVQPLVIDPLVAFIERSQRAGELVAADPMVVVGALRAVLLLPVHRAEFDPATYDAILDLLVDAITTGLTAKQGGTGR